MKEDTGMQKQITELMLRQAVVVGSFGGLCARPHPAVHPKVALMCGTITVQRPRVRRLTDSHR